MHNHVGEGRFVAFAVLAAALYALSTPFSKILLQDVPSNMMAAFLYLGAGLGMAAVGFVHAVRTKEARSVRTEEPLSREDLPFVLAMVALDVAAPLLLMAGLSHAPAENVALLNNFEIVATALIALAVFREPVSHRLWAGIAVITAACVLLSVPDGAFAQVAAIFAGAVEGGAGDVGPAGAVGAAAASAGSVGLGSADAAAGAGSAFRFTPGSLLVLGACLCWGFENNCTSKLSAKDPLQIVVVKGIGSGSGAFVIALAAGDALPALLAVAAALLLGFAAYGLSIFFYVHAQRGLGAARTSAFYAVAPFIGVALSWALFRQPPGATFLAALALMALGTWLSLPAKKEPGAAEAEEKRA